MPQKSWTPQTVGWPYYNIYQHIILIYSVCFAGLQKTKATCTLVMLKCHDPQMGMEWSRLISMTPAWKPSFSSCSTRPWRRTNNLQRSTTARATTKTTTTTPANISRCATCLLTGFAHRRCRQGERIKERDACDARARARARAEVTFCQHARPVNWCKTMIKSQEKNAWKPCKNQCFSSVAFTKPCKYQ